MKLKKMLNNLIMCGLRRTHVVWQMIKIAMEALWFMMMVL